jgi:hypothetical protein
MRNARDRLAALRLRVAWRTRELAHLDRVLTVRRDIIAALRVCAAAGALREDR